MQVNEILSKDGVTLRIVGVREDICLCIDCRGTRMPGWKREAELEDWSLVPPSTDEQALTPEELRVAHERYTVIAPVLAFLTDDAERNKSRVAGAHGF